MNRDQKTAVVDEIASQLGEAEAVFAVDYRGITVAQAAELRTKLRDADASFRIVKNRLTSLAAEKAGRAELKDHLVGPTALTMVRGDVALAAKALSDLSKQLDSLEFKGGLMNGEVLDADQIKSIARLPGRDTLNAQLVGMVASPLSGLARGLNALIAGIAIQLRQIEEQGLVGGDTPAPEPEAPKEEPSAQEEGISDSPTETSPEETDQPEAEEPAEVSSEEE